LQQHDYGEVRVAENGKVALDTLKDVTFDLILLDLEMPEMDGLELLRHLKSDMRLRDIPVIIISSHENIVDIVHCIELGAEDYVHKPFDPVLLHARIGASLSRKRLLDQRNKYMEQLREEKRRSDELINVVLPATAAAELKASGRVLPRRFDNVGLMFCDIVDFTKYCDSHPPEVVVEHLQSLFEKFEAVVTSHGMEKIITIGDEFMATAGMFQPSPTPLLATVKCGLDMARSAAETEPKWEVRIGAHVGPVVAGIVERQKYQFDLWGDTVNMAAHDHAGQPGDGGDEL
jgi:class 3 adenylate cyclase